MKYRALMYRNEGNGVRLLIANSEVTDSADVAMKFAEDLKLDNPKPEFWTCVVSKVTSPQSFP